MSLRNINSMQFTAFFAPWLVPVLFPKESLSPSSPDERNKKKKFNLTADTPTTRATSPFSAERLSNVVKFFQSKLKCQLITFHFDRREDAQELLSKGLVQKLRKAYSFEVNFFVRKQKFSMESLQTEVEISDFVLEEHKELLSQSFPTTTNTLKVVSVPERSRLRRILQACSNLLESSVQVNYTHNQMNNAILTGEITQAKRKIEIVEKTIDMVTSSQGSVIDKQIIEEFIPILLAYPGLALIGSAVAKKRGFVRHKLLIFQLISHGYLEKYFEVILNILRAHPEVLTIRHPATNLLPCDKIKSLPENLPQDPRGIMKYRLFKDVVNFAAREVPDLVLTKDTSRLPNVSDQIASTGSPSSGTLASLDYGSQYNLKSIKLTGILSSYEDDEELIIRAAQFGLLATESELRTRQFDFHKRDKHQFSLLVLLLIAEVSPHQIASVGGESSTVTAPTLSQPDSSSIRDLSREMPEVWLTFTLYLNSLKQRISANKLTLREAKNIVIESLNPTKHLRLTLQRDFSINENAWLESRIYLATQDVRMEGIGLM